MAISKGVYRIPYATGITVRVSQDDQSHDPQNRYDLKSQSGDKRIVAAADGVVQVVVDHFSQNRPGGEPENNNYVWIGHPTGEWTKYTHMSQGSVTEDAGVRAGMFVKAGHLLGFEDHVGSAHGKHLHFEVAVPTNPFDAVDATDASGKIKDGENRIPWVFGPPNHKLVKGDEWQAVPIPPLLLDPAKAEFGPVNLGREKTIDFTVANTSGVNLRVRIPGSPSGSFQWPPLDQVINNQERVRLDLKFKPVGIGQTTKKLRVVVVNAPPNSGLPPARAVTLSGFGRDDEDDPPHVP